MLTFKLTSVVQPRHRRLGGDVGHYYFYYYYYY